MPRDRTSSAGQPLRSSPAKKGTEGLVVVLAVLMLTCSPAAGQAPGSRDGTAVIGQPIGLEVHPARVNLRGPRARTQLVITGKYADGKLRDLTSLADITPGKPGLVRLEAGHLTPLGDGETTLTIRAGAAQVQMPITVQDFQQPQPVSFRLDVIAALNVGGCNAGACHGTPSGKNGFKLSLRGYHPAADYEQLTRDLLGRRIDRLAPERSLVLLKATGGVLHEGGTRFSRDSIAYQTLHAWMAEGLRNDLDLPPDIQRLEIIPGSRILHAPARRQQLAVLAHFADGSVRDVTRLTVFSTSDQNVAEVSGTGLVEFLKVGEVAILCRYLDHLHTVRLTYLEPRPGFVWPNPPENNYVDRHVFARLKQLNIAPADLCTDNEFVRRVFLDVCGRLPTPAEVRTFLADTNKARRARLIDQLLDRPEYADFWTLKWLDLLRANRKWIQAKGAEVYRQWLRDRIARNTPFDQVVRELLTATGHSYSNGPANYFRVAREPGELVEATAQLFLGVRMQCAKCHNHPFERWTQNDYYSLAAFFARVKLKTDSGKKFNMKKAEPETVLIEQTGEVKHLHTGLTAFPKFPGGIPAIIGKDQDRREALAKWLTAPDNPFFARALVNRLWFHLHGRGIVDPPDDFRESNPPANEELLDALARDFIAHQFDVKYILRVLLNSRTYQLSAYTTDVNRDDDRYFSHAQPRLLTAEQMLDAVCDLTEVPEKFPGVPVGTRAVQLPDGQSEHLFLRTMGVPARDLPCECERDTEANLAAALQLLNGNTVQSRLKAEKNRLGRLLASKASDRAILEELYLAGFARLPEAREAEAVLRHVQQSADRRQAWEDVLWALINCKEFMYRY